MDVAPPVLTAPDAPAASRGVPGAEIAAREAFAANVSALGTSHPALTQDARTSPAGVTPAFGRDGSLSAFDEAGRWWSGCSLPLRAAREVLKTLDVRGPVACFLAPPHAAYVRTALEKLQPWQAVVALVPEERELRVMLQCEDFSDAISRGRLWFAWGKAWATRLEELFREQPGLPTPSQFIRLPGADAQVIDPLISASQKVFPEVLARRAGEVAALRGAWRMTPDKAARICVVSPSRFELWNDAAGVLHQALQDTAPAGTALIRVRTDEPASSSPLAVARAAAGCNAIVTADSGRADAPDLLAADMPWLTWVTKPRVPRFDSTAAHDVLLLADPAWGDLARDAGWPAGRIATAGWPRESGPVAAPARRIPRFAALIADTTPPDPPEHLKDFSSHLLLWNTLRAELEQDPFAVGHGPEHFLDTRMQRYGVSAEGFDRTLFLGALVVPAFTQGVARALLAAGVPLRLFGKGWAETAEFKAHAGGPVVDRESLRHITHAASALVHAWPSPHAHPMDACGRPVVRYAGGGAPALAAAARAALKGAVPVPAPGEALSARRVIELLGLNVIGDGG